MPRRGLRNPDNVCYANATMQVWCSLPPVVSFLDALADAGHPLASGLSALLHALDSTEDDAAPVDEVAPDTAPPSLLSEMMTLMSDLLFGGSATGALSVSAALDAAGLGHVLRGGGQQDAQELHVALATALTPPPPPRRAHPEPWFAAYGAPPPAGGAPPPLSAPFSCTQLERLHCSGCAAIGIPPRPWVPVGGCYLPLRPALRSTTVAAAVSLALADEPLDGFMCEVGGGAHKVVQQHHLIPPPVLVLHIARAGVGWDGGAAKHGGAVLLAPRLSLPPFPGCSGAGAGYTLHGVVEHLGGPAGGHYVGWARAEGGGWWRCSDEVVRGVELSAVLRAEPSLAFYVRD